MEFIAFKTAVAKQFERMVKHPLFRVNVSKDTLWATYLGAFPDGTNPMFRERTEHDCSCCRSFIGAVGNVVAVIDNKLVSIWDVGTIADEPAYTIVAQKLDHLVARGTTMVPATISDVFLSPESVAGTDKNIEDLFETAKRRGESLKEGTPRTLQWNHFFVNIPRQHVRRGYEIPSALHKPRTNRQMFERSLTDISIEAIDTVLDLIAQGSLYRGDEHKHAVTKFRQLKVKLAEIDASELDAFCWSVAIDSGVHESVKGIHATAIGTLLVDLTKGVNLDRAVASFESKVAPANYKRTSALITPQMVENAKETVASLGLTSALQRRYATMTDITVNNILFADRSAKSVMGGDVFAELAATTPNRAKVLDRIEEVPITKFITEVVPRAEVLEVLVENRHESNLMSLIAPMDPTASRLFKWDNNFSWSYNGDVADAIKARVKAAGGAVDGDLCCRLAWNYTDDLDFHMIEPNGHRIYFSNRGQRSPMGGVLDLDANGRDGPRADPAENIVYADRKSMHEGDYRLEVNNYNRRSDGCGFEVEIEFDGQRHNFVYDRVVRDGETIRIATIRYTKSKGFEIIESIEGQQSSKSLWSLSTQAFHRVNVLMLSPNYWDGNASIPAFAGPLGIGNMHFFFMLNSCVNDGRARPFYNEFLKEELSPHRKVFEVLGGKLKVEESPNQLSGLGFSSTQRASVVVRVTGASTRVLRVLI